MKAVVAAFNQEKALVGAFSVITNFRICFGWNFLKHYYLYLSTRYVSTSVFRCIQSVVSQGAVAAVKARAPLKWRQATPLNTAVLFVPQQEAWVVERCGKWVVTSASKSSIRRFVITEKAPTRASS